MTKTLDVVTVIVHLPGFNIICRIFASQGLKSSWVGVIPKVTLLTSPVSLWPFTIKRCVPMLYSSTVVKVESVVVDCAKPCTDAKAIKADIAIVLSTAKAPVCITKAFWLGRHFVADTASLVNPSAL